MGGGIELIWFLFLLFLKLFLVWGVFEGVEVEGGMMFNGEVCLVKSGREGEEGGIADRGDWTKGGVIGRVDWSNWFILW